MLATLLTGLLIVGCPRAGAQGFGLSVTSSANAVLVSNSVTFTINLTNLTATVLPHALVTNTLPASVLIQSFEYATNSNVGTVTAMTNNSVTVFDLHTFALGGRAQLFVTAQLMAAGFVTNFVTVISQPAGYFATNGVMVQVTNPVTTEADLGVAIAGPTQAVITNDWVTYGVMVTNLGPATAPNVTLTNTLPPGALLKGVSPSSPGYSRAGSNLIFNLGALTSGGGATFQFTVQPTNAGTLALAASVGVTGVLDTNAANDIASNNVAVMAYLPGTLLAVTNSGQNLDVVSGLTEQSILVTNTGTTNVPAVRLVVTGLTNQLFNAVGANNGNPYVVYAAGLATNRSGSLLLQFYPSTFFPFTNGQLHAYAVPTPDWTPPPVKATSTSLNITRLVKLNNGWRLIEFPTTPGRTYTVVYSTNVSFSDAMIAPPSITAPANRMQWIDYGPPATVSAPTDAPVRFYRVYLSP
jgi:uncharacterized repeat protein (TIGR01451 family)